MRQDAGHVLIIGAGLAGLFTALKLAPLPVTVLAARAPGGGASSVWAQGGIAAALGADDSPALHAADTIAAGAGIVDPAIAKILTEEAPARIADLARLGVPFDRDAEGRFLLGREAAHGRRRIVHVNGDRAGAAIMKALIKAVQDTPSIRVIWGYRAVSLARSEGRVAGVHAVPVDEPNRHPVLFAAPFTVLASGGVGALYAVTTNPAEAQGDGLAMAARAGAVIADPEFVQFHPTAIAVARDPAPLATEALRGEGAILVNERGERFMSGHPQAELAPRDVVARAIHREIERGGRAFLDCRKAIGARFAERFPTVYAACREAGIDPVAEPIPIAPAAHFHMGGIAADAVGKSSLDGLYACGEVASTGAHGANRLASNSLLEALVFGARIADAIKDLDAPPCAAPNPWVPEPWVPEPWIIAERRGQEGVRPALRAMMTRCVGLERTEAGLTEALCILQGLDSGPLAPNGGLATVGVLIAAAALLRRESRGGHFRLDHRGSEEYLAHRTFLTLAEARAVAAAALAGPFHRAREAAP